MMKFPNLLGVKKVDRSWIEIIGWWEIRRIPFNLILLIVGLLSLFISYISIPLIYMILGLGLNILYCFGWIIDIQLSYNDQLKGLNINHSKKLFLVLLAFSILAILSISLLLLIN